MSKKLVLLVLIFFLLIQNVSASSEESAMQAIEEAEKVISEMQEMGFGVTYANDTLNEAKLMFTENLYPASESLAKGVLEIKEKAITVNQLIDEVEPRIYELSSEGYDVSIVVSKFSSGMEEFGLDNYLEAENTMREIVNMLDEIESEESLKRTSVSKGEDYFSLILDYLWLIIILFLVVLIIVAKYKGYSYMKKSGKKLAALEMEKEIITNKLKEAQSNYYEKGSISKLDYDLIVGKYNNKLAFLKKEISILKGKLSLT